MKELLESGKITLVIDGGYILEKTADAFQYHENAYPCRKVAITAEKEIDH